MPNSLRTWVIPRAYGVVGTTDRIVCGSYAGLDEASGTTLSKMPAFTLAALVRTTGTLASLKRIINRMTTGGAGWRFGVTGTGGAVQFLWTSASTAIDYRTTDNLLTPFGTNRWQWVICAFDSTAGTGNRVTFWGAQLNGVPQRAALNIIAEPAGSYQSNTGANLCIGNDCGNSPAFPFPGQIALAAIFPGRWSDGEATRFVRDPLAWDKRALGFWLPGVHDNMIVDYSGRHPLGTRAGTTLVQGTFGRRRVSLRDYNFASDATTAPTIAVSDLAPSLEEPSPGVSPAQVTINITNGGTGDLVGLSLSDITMVQALEDRLTIGTLTSTTAPASFTIDADTTGLAGGNYPFSITVNSDDPLVSNTPQVVVGEVIVSDLGLDVSDPAFTGYVGGANPADVIRAVVDIGGGLPITGMAVTVTYDDPDDPGGISASLSQTSTPADLTVSCDFTGLQPRFRTAVLEITTPDAPTVRFVVSDWLKPIAATSSVKATAKKVDNSSYAIAVPIFVNSDLAVIDKTTNPWSIKAVVPVFVSTKITYFAHVGRKTTALLTTTIQPNDV